MSEAQSFRELIGPTYLEVAHQVKHHESTHFWFKGGRGSLKSSFVALNLVMLVMFDPDANVVVMRKVADTLRESVYEQVLWAIDALGAGSKFREARVGREIVYRPTGQRIIFRGVDRAGKVKSFKLARGFVKALWFEEVDQFAGMPEIRSVNQSLVRGGDRVWCFYSFNPPRSRDNWANKELAKPTPTLPDGTPARIVHTSNYLDVPPEWLGEAFLAEAQLVKDLDEKAYRHEYLGEAIGSGGNVFDNVTVRKITAEERMLFDRPLNGVDFGFFPDPWAFTRSHYAHAQRTLFIFRDRKAVRASDEETAGILREELSDENGMFIRERVTCDSADPKAIDKYRELGQDARGAVKGPGSVDHSMKWLASRIEIVIDEDDAPNAAGEFTSYEFEQDKAGEYVSGYPDEDNHWIDATRYGTEQIWTRRANV